MDKIWNVTFRKGKRNRGIGDDVFRQLVEYAGESNGSKVILRNLTQEEFGELRHLCVNLGISLPSTQAESCEGTGVSCAVQYSDAEFRSSPYLELARGEALAYPKSVADATLQRDKYFEGRKELLIGPIGNGRFGIRGAALEELSSRELDGLDFRSVNIEGGWMEGEDKIFELSSNIILPQMISVACNDLGDIFNPGEIPKSDDGFYVLDGNIADSRIAFRPDTLPQFDLALTKAKFGPVQPQAAPRLICSNRFFAVTSAISPTLEWKIVIADNHFEYEGRHPK